MNTDMNTDMDRNKLQQFVTILANKTYSSQSEYDEAYVNIKYTLNITPSHIQLLFMYDELKRTGVVGADTDTDYSNILYYILPIIIANIVSTHFNIKLILILFLFYSCGVYIYIYYNYNYKNNNKNKNKPFDYYIIKQIGKSPLGVTPITVITNPYSKFIINTPLIKQRHVCGLECSLFKDVDTQPLYYSEPSFNHAKESGFDSIKQFNLSINNMVECVNKIEITIVGGTWSHYKPEYKEGFIRDLYYAANNYSFINKSDNRGKLSLQEEMFLNETAKCRIIGIIIETLPDCIYIDTIPNLYKLGITGISIGVHHLDKQ